MSRAASSAKSFVPALGSDWLTPFYDAVAWLLGERSIKRQLVEQARIAPGHDVLDLGCGTGTLVLMVKAMHPGANVTGLDIDPRILALARAKIADVGVEVALVEGSATAPPFAPATFDRVLSTLVLHHLTTTQKLEALGAVRRLLRPGGELHVADWGKPQNMLMQVASWSFRIADGDATTGANLRGELPMLVMAAGFRDVRETDRRMTPLGTVAYLAARAD